MTQRPIKEMTVEELESEAEASMSIAEKIVRADQRRIEVNKELIKRLKTL